MTDKEKPMTDWTPELLDALPSMTVIQWTESAEGHWALLEVPTNRYGWMTDGAIYRSSDEIVKLSDPGSIRVVSVPIDALLSRNALEAATDAFAMTTNLVGILGNEAEQAVRAAIAHATGGTA